LRLRTTLRRSFNPLPAMKPGGTRAMQQDAQTYQCFNPLPAMKPGGTKHLVWEEH